MSEEHINEQFLSDLKLYTKVVSRYNNIEFDSNNFLLSEESNFSDNDIAYFCSLYTRVNDRLVERFEESFDETTGADLACRMHGCITIELPEFDFNHKQLEDFIFNSLCIDIMNKRITTIYLLAKLEDDKDPLTKIIKSINNNF